MAEKICDVPRARRNAYRCMAADRFANGRWIMPDVFKSEDDLANLYHRSKDVEFGDGLERISLACLHHVHVSEHPEKSDMIAYTRTFEDGVRDRQIRIKLGRYLAQAFGDQLSPQRIAELVAKHNEYQQEKIKWHIAMTPKRIVTVYLRGPNSCMSKGMDYYARSTNYHPTYVYGAGDLGVAFIWRGGRITARALVWPERKIYGRIYGDEDRLCRVLREAGYQPDYAHFRAHNDKAMHKRGFNGAKLLAIRDDYGDLQAPYIDGCYGVNDCGEFLELTNCSPEYKCESVTGLVQDAGTQCDHCGEYADADETHGTADSQIICEGCYDNYYFYCEDTDEIYHVDDMHVTHDGRNICTQQYQDYYFTCDDTGDIYPNSEKYTTHDGREICREQFLDHYFTCDECGEIFPTEQWNDCETSHSIRCDDCHEKIKTEDETHEQEAA